MKTFNNKLLQDMIAKLIEFANEQRMVLNDEMVLDIYNFINENLQYNDYDNYSRYMNDFLRNIEDYSIYSGCIQLYDDCISLEYFDEINERLEAFAVYHK